MEEGHVCLAGDGFREQGLAGARHADEKGALRDARSHLHELLRVLEVVDYLEKLVFRLLLAGDILEGRLLRRLDVALGPAFAEAEGLVVSLHLPQHQPDNEEPEQPWSELDDDLPGARALEPSGNPNFLRAQSGEEVGIGVRDRGLEYGLRARLALQSSLYLGLIEYFDGVYLSLIEAVEKGRICYLAGCPAVVEKEQCRE